MKNSRLLKFVLMACIFATGFCGFVAELLISTTASYLLGDAVSQFALIMGLMLFSMGVGSFFSSKISKREREIFIFIEIILSFLCATSVLAINNAAIYNWHQPMILFYCIAIGLLIGLEIPLITRINEQLGVILKKNISSVMYFDYIGSLFGAIAFSFFFIKKFGLTYAPMVLGLINLSVALVLLFVMYEGLVKKFSLVFYSASGFVVLIALLFFASPIMRYSMEEQYDDQIVFAQQTQYQKLIITRDYLGETGYEYRLWINGGKQFSSVDEHRYHEMLVHPGLSYVFQTKKYYDKSPVNVLVLGGGDGMAVREVLKNNVDKVVLIDLDQEMINIFKGECENSYVLSQTGFDFCNIISVYKEGFKKDTLFTYNSMCVNYLDKEKNICHKMAQLNGYSLHDPRVEVIIHDAFVYLWKNNKKKNILFDMVIVDLPDPSTVGIGKLYSREFYKLVQGSLKKNGIVVTQASSPYHSNEAFLTILKTMRSSGLVSTGYHVNVPSFGEWGFVIGNNKKTTTEKFELKLKNLEIDVPTEFLNEDSLMASFLFGKNAFDGYSKVKASTINLPSVVFAYEKGWEIE